MGVRWGKTYPIIVLPTPVLPLPFYMSNWMSVARALFLLCKYQTHDIDYNLYLINLVIDSFMKSGHSKEFDSSFILILTVISDRWKRDRSDGYSANSFLPYQIAEGDPHQDGNVRTRHHCMFQQVLHTCFKIIKTLLILHQQPRMARTAIVDLLLILEPLHL